jgi:hypothetical protein
MLFALSAGAGVTDLRLSTAQIFDVQWNISGGMLNTSGFNYIYASVNYATQTTSAARWTAAQTADAGSNGRYISFFHSTTHPGTYGMAVFNSDGSVYKIINNTGSFRTLADGAIFYNGNGMWGTLITTKQGYNYGQSASFVITQQYPTNAQLEAYTVDSTTPLAAGETAAPSEPLFSSGITAQQQQSKNIATLLRQQQQGNELYIEQIGDNNNITLRQGSTASGRNRMTVYSNGNDNTLNLNQGYLTDGAVSVNDSNNHYLYLHNSGNSNNITTRQTDGTTAGVGHYNETTISGNSNVINLQQTGSGHKTLFANINGGNNAVTATQQGTGQHYLDINLSGNGHTVNALQDGIANHAATINLTNGGGSSSLTMNQLGSTAQTYSIDQTCVNAGGCNTTITQGQ